MFTNFPFFPPQASEQAASIDALYFFLLTVTGFFAVLIAILVAVFATKFHRKHADEVGEVIHGSLALELLWTVIPLGITMVMFVWGAQVFFHMTRAPKEAMDIYVVGKTRHGDPWLKAALGQAATPRRGPRTPTSPPATAESSPDAARNAPWSPWNTPFSSRSGTCSPTTPHTPILAASTSSNAPAAPGTPGGW